MKKILLAILFIAFSIGVSEAKITLKPTGIRKVSADRVMIDRNKPMKVAAQIPQGLTYWKDLENSWENLSADYAIGSAVFTYTRASGGGSYYDSTGKVYTFATGQTNLPILSPGYYDATGFHTGNKGLKVEATITNRATYSGTPENAAWTKTNITADNDDAGSSSPDGVATANSLTASAANGTFVQAYAITGDPATYTVSVWLKRKTGTGVVDLGAVEDGTGKAAVTVTTEWTRHFVTATTDGDDAGKDPAFYLELESDTDAVYVYGMQLEASPVMTSYTPNATTAVTRGAEVLTYLIANNRTAEAETIVIKFAPGGTFANDGVERDISGTDTKNRAIFKVNTRSDVTSYPNITDSGSSVAISNTSPINNTKLVVSSVFQHVNPYANIFYDGVSKGTETVDDYINPLWGASFYLGSNNAGANQGNIIIERVEIYNRPLSASEVLNRN